MANRGGSPNGDELSRAASDPIEGGSANDYDYGNADPCNNYDLDGRASKKGSWLDRYNKCMKEYRWLVNRYKKMVRIGAAGLIAEASNESVRGKMKHLPWYRTLMGSRLARFANRAAAGGLAAVGVAGVGGLIGQSLYCEVQATRGQTS